MDIAANIKKLRGKQGLIQKQVAAELDIGYSNYNKMENGLREPSVGELQKLAKLFSITVDELINPEDITPKEVVIEDKTVSEKVRLISQLDQEDQQAVYRIIDGMLTKNKFETLLENMEELDDIRLYDQAKKEDNGQRIPMEEAFRMIEAKRSGKKQ